MLILGVARATLGLSSWRSLTLAGSIMSLTGERLVNGRLEATHVFHRHVLCIRGARVQVFVQGGEDLSVEHLEPPDTIDHSFQLLYKIAIFISSICKYLGSTYDSLDVLVLAINPLNSKNVVAKVEALESPLLIEESDEDAPGPVEALAEHLLDVELVLADGDAVDKLQGRPQTMEFGAFVDVQDTVGGRLALPNGVVEVALDAVENHLKYREAAAEALPR